MEHIELTYSPNLQKVIGGLPEHVQEEIRANRIHGIGRHNRFISRKVNLSKALSLIGTHDYIFDCINTVFGVGREQITGSSHRREISEARYTFSSLAVKTKLSDTEISAIINKERTTVLYHKRTAANMYETSAIYRAQYAKVCALIALAMPKAGINETTKP